jgi:cell wall-associated NlpC family hydrolase
VLAPNDVIRTAREWLGVPFRHQGRSRHGVDCVGLVLGVYRELGVSLPDDAVYPREMRGQALYDIAGHYFAEVDNREAGDILRYSVAGFPTPHIAIDAGDTIIHAFYKHGRVVEQLEWKRGPITFQQAYRFNG